MEPATETLQPILIGGEWTETGSELEVRSPYDDSLVARVAQGDAGSVDRAISAALAAQVEVPAAHERAAVLDRASALVAERADDLAETIAREAGKPLKTAKVEVDRCVSTLRFSALEARRLGGELVPMEAAAAGEGKLGVMLRVPLGVVAAISPFNFPLNLVAHKLGPALAAGNAVVLKPASQTPLSALGLARILLDAGLPDGLLSVVCGPAGEVGDALTGHEGIAAISFTGSAPVGWSIREKAARKRVGLELGSNAPLIVMADGDWETAADKAQIHAYSHAGQSCISIQRILVDRDIAEPFTQRLVANVQKLKVGDPLDPETDVGPLISADDRDRVSEWIGQAVELGGEVLTGGELVDEGRCISPAVIAEPPRNAHVWCDEVFGPVATLSVVDSLDDAIERANDSRFGLQAGIFTSNVGAALQAARQLEFGGVLVNEVPTFRADQMPYGGVKESGNTREGPAYAIEEYTERRFVTLQG